LGSGPSLSSRSRLRRDWAPVRAAQDSVPNPYQPGEISVAEAAHRLGCATSVLYHWIHTQQLSARRGCGQRFCIPWNDQTEAECRSRIHQSAHLNRNARPRKLPAPAFPAADGHISVTEAPIGSDAAPGSSTTGSKPGNSPPTAAPGTGYTSPGTTTSRRNAATASTNPGTSTLPPDAPSPADEADPPRNVGATRHAHAITPGLTSTAPAQLTTSQRAIAGGAV
jgi:hypothetical protein